ncbi:MAG: response regulator transcription factor [Planctomycetota bacterium]
MNKSIILVVEDDAAIRRGIVDALQFQGFHTLEAASGDAGLQTALGADCLLLLLDVVLPGKDGFTILRVLREQRPSLPVILLTARGEEADRVRGLRLGADDYVVKPFSVRELLARVEAVLRRSPSRPTEPCLLPFAFGEIDLANNEVQFHDQSRATLSDRETNLLRYLAGQNGRIVSRSELLTQVWGIDAANIETRTVDMQIARLREKLRDSHGEARVLITVRGKGYRLARNGEPT